MVMMITEKKKKRRKHPFNTICLVTANIILTNPRLKAQICPAIASIISTNP